MSKDNDSPSMTRRSALLTAGSLGAGALAIPGAASAKSDASKTDDYSVTFDDRGVETYKYVGEDANAEPQVTPDAVSADVVCYQGYCLTVEASLTSENEVSVDILVGGTRVGGALLDPYNASVSGSFDIPGANGQFEVDADFTGSNVEINASGKVCVLGFCESGSTSFTVF